VLLERKEVIKHMHTHTHTYTHTHTVMGICNGNIEQLKEPLVAEVTSTVNN
jgi:hypothetical protein